MKSAGKFLLTGLMVSLLAACGSSGSGSGATPSTSTPSTSTPSTSTPSTSTPSTSTPSTSTPPPVVTATPSLYYQPANTTATATPSLSSGNFSIVYPDGTTQNVSNGIQAGTFVNMSSGTRSLMLGGTRYADMRFGGWVDGSNQQGGVFAVGTPSTSLPSNSVLNFTGKGVFVNTSGVMSAFDTTNVVADTLNKTVSVWVYNGVLGGVAVNKAPITGTTFAGTLCNGGTWSCSGAYQDGTGTIKGGFFGADATQVGGTFSAQDVNGKQLGVGAFGASR